MADKPGFSVASGFQGGVTIGIAANTWPEFIALCEMTWPGEGELVARGLYGNLRNQSGLAPLATEQQAVQMVQQQLGGQVIPPDTRNGQVGVGYQQPNAQYQQAPPAQQGYAQQPPQYQQPQAQNGPPPGQTCDPKDASKTKWVPPGVSSKPGPKFGQPYPGFWAKP